MKATLQFDLRDDRYEFDAAMNGSKNSSILSEIYSLARSALKYTDTKEEFEKALEEIKKLAYTE